LKKYVISTKGKGILSLFFTTAFLLFSGILHAGIPTPIPNNHRGNGLLFTPNKGQIADVDGNLRPDVLYKGSGVGADIYLRKTGISYVFTNLGEVMKQVKEQAEALEMAGKFREADENQKKQELLQKATIKVHRVDMDFIDCNSNTKNVNEDEVEGYTNYYYAHCPAGVTNVKSFNKVTRKNIYDNIDVIYYGNKTSGIKYDIIVQPNADPNQIKLQWTGADNISLNSEGKLVIRTNINKFYEAIPKVFQYIDGEIVSVKAAYILMRTTVGFKLGTYNPEYPLIIDPWATYYGGSGLDASTSIAPDNNGDVYITGYTASKNFPVTSGAFQTIYTGGNEDSFIAKFNPSGTRLWATYYGGSFDEQGTGIAIDNIGNATITGYTYSSDFPITAGAFQTSLGIPRSGITFPNNAFIVKFTSSGIRKWATYYGGNAGDNGLGIATDNAGNILITGGTESSNFPVLNGYQMSLLGSYNAFLVKLDSSGTVKWATFYGGTNFDQAQGIATDNVGNSYITGYTSSSDFPLLNNFQTKYGGGTIYGDAFIAKFNSSGVPQWSTFYGGSSEDNGRGIAIDSIGNILVAGYTSSSDFPVFNGYQMTYGGEGPKQLGDAFVVKFTSSGIRQWATYYGGTEDDFARGVATDTKSNIYLLFEAEDETYAIPVDACAYDPIFNGGSLLVDPEGGLPEDLMIVKFNPSGGKVCSTYLGGTGEDDLDNNGGGIAVGGNSLLITAATDGGYPVTTGAFQTAYGGGSGYEDIFVNSLCINICEGKVLGLNFSASSTSVCGNIPITFSPTITNSCDTSGYNFLWTFQGGSPAISTSSRPAISYNAAGSFGVKLVLTTPCQKDSLYIPSYIHVTASGITVNTSSFPDTCSKRNGIAMANPSGGNSSFTYNWSNGNSGQTASGLTNGNYYITVTDAAGCAQTQAVNVLEILGPTLNASSFPDTCNKVKGLAIANAAGGNGTLIYTWSNGAGGLIDSGLTSGLYSVTVTDAVGCTQTKSVSVSQIPGPKATAISTSDNIVKGASITLTGGGGVKYLWNPDTTLACNTCNITTASPLHTTYYCVLVTDTNNCVDTACVNINVENTCDIFVPNAFSPNEDGKNDILYVRSLNCITQMHLQIFNRWGELVFETFNPETGWNGSFMDKQESMGVFVYYLTGTMLNGTNFEKKGNVTLVR